MNTRARHVRNPSEQLISALLPDVHTPRPAPRPVLLPSLPVPTPPWSASPGILVLGIARVDRSGRVHERALLRTLGWGPGRELDLDTSPRGIVIAAAAGGAHRVDDRGAITLPAADRRMCGIPTGPPVVLLADAPRQLLVVQSAATVARMLIVHQAALIGDSDEH